MIDTQQYIRKPLYVDAVRVTAANFDEIAAWCQGEVQQDDAPDGKSATKKYIKVRVHNPKNPRQTKAFVGDWLLYTERGYKVYTNKAFYASFDPAPEPIVTGSEEIAPGTSLNDAVEQLRQQDEVKALTDAQIESFGPVAEEPSQETGVQPIQGDSADMAEAKASIEAEGGTVEEATPEGIAEAVQQNDQARTEEETTSPSRGEPTTHADKQVLSLEEQENMDQDEIRELLKTGEWVLAQDLAA